MRTPFYVFLALMLPLAASAQSYGAHKTPAQAAASFAPPPASDVNAPADASGEAVNDWISLQESGTRSVRDTPPLPGTIASKIYQRYVNSFTHPIPDRFSRESFGVGGSGGGGGG